MLTHPLHLLFHSFTPHFIHFFTSMFYPSLSTHSVTVAEVFVDPPKTYLLLQFTTLRVVKKGYVACSGQKGIRESHMILFQAETLLWPVASLSSAFALPSFNHTFSANTPLASQLLFPNSFLQPCFSLRILPCLLP